MTQINCATLPNHLPQDPTFSGDYVLSPNGKKHEMNGKASWYGKRFNGRKTASGDIFDSTKMTAAHKTLPFGTTVRVVDIITKRCVIVRINDRGPFKKGRVIDLSEAAAEKLGMKRRGVIPVQLSIMSWGEK